MKQFRLFRQVGRSAASLWHDESGIILPYVTILLVVIVGVSLLALDGGRARSFQSQMQNAADALALAGAAELNRAPGSRARAISAINNLIANGLEGMGVTNVQLDHPVDNNDFYESIPVASQYFTSGTVARDDGHARFVGITLKSVSLSTIFPVTFLGGGTNGYTAGASAVAGMDEVSCKITPLFVCNPYETANMTYDQATAELFKSSNIGNKMFILQFAANKQYFAGNFGFLDNSQFVDKGSCGSHNTVAQALAQEGNTACFVQNAVDTQTGNVAPADEALNTRFDLYSNSFNNCDKDPNYPPAPNVRKGFLKQGGNACNQNPIYAKNDALDREVLGGNYAARGFPLDSNMIKSDGINFFGTPDTSVISGNGNWACSNSQQDTTATVSSVQVKGQDQITLPLSSTAGIFQGMAVHGGGIATGTTVNNTASVINVTPTNVTIALNSALTVNSGETITFQGYWSTAHPGGASPPVDTVAGTSCANNNISRQFVYQDEITRNLLGDTITGGAVGGPTCSSQTANSGSDRRFVNVATLNCLNLIKEGYKLTGSSPNLPVAAFVKYFLTIPVENAQGPIYAEYGGVVKAGAGSNLYYQVQLYR